MRNDRSPRQKGLPAGGSQLRSHPVAAATALESAPNGAHAAAPTAFESPPPPLPPPPPPPPPPRMHAGDPGRTRARRG